LHARQSPIARLDSSSEAATIAVSSTAARCAPWSAVLRAAVGHLLLGFGQRTFEGPKAWFRVRDTYGVEIAPGQDDALILAITVRVDSMARG
jgi:hypothetical protein